MSIVTPEEYNELLSGLYSDEDHTLEKNQILEKIAECLDSIESDVDIDLIYRNLLDIKKAFLNLD